MAKTYPMSEIEEALRSSLREEFEDYLTDDVWDEDKEGYRVKLARLDSMKAEELIRSMNEEDFLVPAVLEALSSVIHGEETYLGLNFLHEPDEIKRTLERLTGTDIGFEIPAHWNTD